MRRLCWPFHNWIPWGPEYWNEGVSWQATIDGKVYQKYSRHCKDCGLKQSRFLPDVAEENKRKKV